MIQVNIPDKNAAVNFPDDTPPEVMREAIKKRFYKPSVMEVITDTARIPLNLAAGAASFLNPLPGIEGIGRGIGTLAGGGSVDDALKESTTGINEIRGQEETVREYMGKVLPLGEAKTETGKIIESGINKALEVVFKEPAEYWSSKVNPEKNPNLAAVISTFMEIAPLALPFLKKELGRRKVLRVVNDITEKTDKGIDITPEESQILKTEIEGLKTEASKPIESEIPKPQTPIGDVTSRMGEKFNDITIGEAKEMLKKGDSQFIEELKSAIQEMGNMEAEHLTRNLEQIAIGDTPKAERPQVINNIKKIEPEINRVLEERGKPSVEGVEGLSEKASPLKIPPIEQEKILHNDKIVTPKETTAQPYQIGSTVRVGKSLTPHEIIKEIEQTPQEAQLGERFFEVKNLKTGEKGIYDINSLTPIHPKKTEGSIKPVEQMSDVRKKWFYEPIKGGQMADIGGYDLSKPSAIELPEIVEISKDLMNGKYPHIKKKLRAFMGQALGVFKTPKGEIDLRADIFKTEGLAERVLSHEIGHLSDWLPDKTMSRGNILGRIASLKNYLKTLLEEKPGSPFRLEEIKGELKDLTKKWKPFDDRVNPYLTKYRYSAKELYADAVSVLFNDPELLKSTAPEFTKAFFNYIEKKPEVKSIYEDIQMRLKGGNTEIWRVRDKRLDAMLEDGETKYRQPLIEEASRTYRERAAQSELKGKKELVDIAFPLYDSIKDDKLRHEVRKAIENNIYRYAEAEAYFKEQYHNSLKEFIGSGIDERDVGKYLYLRRVINERSEIANPEGFTPKTAKDHLDGMRLRLGEEKFNTLKKVVDNFWKIRKTEVIERLKEANLFDKELMKLIENNEYYATFDVTKYIDKRYGAGAGAKIYKQEGTFEGIANPLTATLLKDMALLNAVNRKIAIKTPIDVLLKEGYKEIIKADTKWNGKFHEIQKSRDPRQSTLLYLEDGKVNGYHIPKDIAASFESNPVESWVITKFLSKTAQPFKEIFVNKRPGFTPFNIIRDIGNALMILKKGATIPKFVPLWIKSLPKTIKGLKEYDPVIQELYKGKALIPSVDRLGETPSDTLFERMLISHGLKSPNGGLIGRAVDNFLNKLQFIGEVGEMTTKRASYEYLKKYHPEMPIDEKMHLVRWSGSPAFLVKGEATPLTSNLFLYSNPAIQGWRAQWGIAKATPLEYAWKRTKYTYIPKLIMYAGAAGLLGEGVKQLYTKMSDYDKTNYFTIPLGETPNKKAVYLRIPQDETGRVLGGVFWKLLNGVKTTDDALALFDYTAGQFPGLNPAISITMDVIDYLSGGNPYDKFRGNFAIPRQVFEAQDRRSIEAFAKYIVNKAGIGIVYKFDTDDVGKIKSDLEKKLNYPITSDIIGRFIKVSDKGLQEELRKPVELIRRDKARISLDAREGIINLINKKPLTDEQISAIEYQIQNKTFDRNAIMLLGKKYGDAFINAYISAKTNEEKIAVYKKMLELR